MAKTATSFESILDTPADRVERPKPLPAGTYDFIVKGLYETGESTQKKTPYVRFTAAVQAAGEDVDEDELNELLTNADGERTALSDKTMRLTYYTTADALFRLTDFLEHCGIELDDGKTVRQALDETPNATFRGVVTHRASQDGTQVFAEISRTMKAED